MRARISEGETKSARRWLCAYALGAVGVWGVSLWVCQTAAEARPRSIFMPPLDALPWAIFGVIVFGVAAVGAIRRRTWGAYVGLFGGLCAVGYQLTDPFEFGRAMSLDYTARLIAGVALVYLPVVVLSARRDALAAAAWSAATVLLAGGLSLGWSLVWRADDSCDIGAAWQQELACPESTLVSREQGRAAARSDMGAGVHRRLTSGYPDDEAREYERWLWSEYGVRTDFVASCLITREQLEYLRGYDEVASSWLDQHLQPYGGWAGINGRWRVVASAAQFGEVPRSPRPDPWPDAPLSPPPPAAWTP
ncbi:MAG: hypothetical protein H6726_09435 [Sandaracinaceae bacterium]|nr:hypothetical protein [Myxococcales bacterium]MCB9657855.1 hypothetical protein [Sandaracinaceae bacterium]